MSASACWRIATPDPNTLSWPAIALQLLWGVRELVTIAVSIALPLTNSICRPREPSLIGTFAHNLHF